METINGARPINPIITENAKSELICEEIGLTKREYFAGLAMQGLLSNSYSNGFSQPLSEYDSKSIAKFSIEYADELLKQLEKNKSLNYEKYFPTTNFPTQFQGDKI